MRLRNKFMLLFLLLFILSNVLIGCDSKNTDSTITIYSLYNDDSIRQSIEIYNSKNKNNKIQYSVGIDNNLAIEVNDAINKLNTDLISGKGPDIIILDNLPISSLKEKGLLEDINDIISKHNDDLFSNIIAAYSEDEKIYSLPLEFSVVKIIGTNIDSINTMDSLASNITNIANPYNKKILNIYSPKELLYTLASGSASTWINDNKTINEEKLSNFLIDCKTIYDENRKYINQSDLNEHNEIATKIIESSSESSYYNHYLYSSSYYHFLFKDGPLLSITEISDPTTFLDINSICSTFPNVSCNTWNGQVNNLFIPIKNVALNSKSKQKDIAKDFIDFLFSEESQSMDFHRGLPVNKVACENKLISYNTQQTRNFTSEKGEALNYEITPVSNEKINEFIKTLEEVSTPIFTNTDFLEKISDPMVEYINGNKNLENTLKDINDKMEIWMNE